METIERIFGIILPVFTIMAIGYGYARWRGDAVRADMGSVNRITMEVLTPLMVFTALASREFELTQNWTLILAGIFISLGSGVLAWPVARLLGYDWRTFVPPAMYGNSGNMGLPLTVLSFGADSLSAAVALFAAGTLVYFSFGTHMLQSGKSGPRVSFWRLLANPILAAMILGVASGLTRISVPAPLFSAMKMLGEASIPIMLFALGVRMIDLRLKSWHIGLAGAIACPATGLIMAWLLDHLMTFSHRQRGQMYLFAALPPAVLCFMFAEQHRQEPEKVASIVLLGNLAALVFVPIGLWMGL
jgi:predicted permease